MAGVKVENPLRNSPPREATLLSDVQANWRFSKEIEAGVALTQAKNERTVEAWVFE